MEHVESKSLYQLLGVERNASKDQIREAYRELARIFHPDSHYYDDIVADAGIDVGESETFKLITDAYNTLTNDKLRAEYDSTTVGNLPDWGEEAQDRWHAEFKVETSPGMADARRRADAVGSFGAARTQRKSSFDEETLNSVRPMSYMIRKRRGFVGRLLNFVGL